jgi:hypothetical protein
MPDGVGGGDIVQAARGTEGRGGKCQQGDEVEAGLLFHSWLYVYICTNEQV